MSELADEISSSLSRSRTSPRRREPRIICGAHRTLRTCRFHGNAVLACLAGLKNLRGGGARPRRDRLRLVLDNLSPVAAPPGSP